jgi:hypothetical protein
MFGHKKYFRIRNHQNLYMIEMNGQRSWTEDPVNATVFDEKNAKRLLKPVMGHIEFIKEEIVSSFS